jgi:ubiquinol-cytochrome c reductase iron-sulfur subunit
VSDATGSGGPGRAYFERRAERRAERLVLIAFGVTFVSGVALLILYLLGGQTQLEGILLTLCLGGLGVGIVIWAQQLMSAEVKIEARHPIGGDSRRIAELGDTLTEEEGFTRRTLLIKALGGALAGLGAALAIPVFSLGPAPGRALYETAWRSGARLAPAGGDPVNPDNLPIGSLLTVYPDGDDSDPNAATLLIRVEPELLRLEGDAASVAPDGYVAYSKICTHAGCPVGLYRAGQHTLICPCHQSEFDVLTGATPISGPAARALPQLPIRREGDAFVAVDDYGTPVGPSFWNMGID